jgi:uncharacterized protein (TIRG00374 family)
MIPGLLISAVCLAIIFFLVDLQKLGSALRLADFRLVLACAVVSVLWLVVRGLLWRTLLQEQASFRDTFLTINEGYLLNNFLPFRLGELGRAFLLSRKANLEFWQVLSSIVIERVLDLAMASGIVLSTLPFVVGAGWAHEAVVVTTGAVVGGLGMLYLLARSQAWAESQFEHWSARRPWLRRLGIERLSAFFKGLGVLTDTGHFLRSVAWISLDWGIAIFQYFLLLLAFEPDGKPLWAIFGLGVAALGIAAPSSPGGIGVYELSVIAAFSLFGINPSIALAYAITMHFLGYLITGLLGAYALVQDGESLGRLFHQIRKARQDI